jgi:competence ComEA-like helix-hairpin-helix protein
MPYSRPQLKLLLVLAVTLLAGLGVREWRAGFPDMAERLERFDREAPAAPLIPAPAAQRRPPPAPSAAPPAAASIGPSPTARRAGPVPVAPTDPRPLDINRASLDELSRLPGVGQGLAGRILAERERRGRFESPDALRYVLGMGPKKLAAIRELIVVSE